MELNNQAEFSPKGLSNKDVQSFVKMGNAILPLLAKKKEDKSKQVSFLNFLMSDVRDKYISKRGQDAVNHADIWNWNDLKK